MAITTGKPSGRCLDLTRLISRVGRGPMTGIDRVELEYLKALLSSNDPVFALVRIVFGYAILDGDGVKAIHDRLVGEARWGRPDAISGLSRKLPPKRRTAEADIRRLAAGTIRRGKLPQGLPKYLPDGVEYINVGHSNLSPEVMQAFRSLEQARITVLIHDTIPLDFPEFQRRETVERFEEKLRTAAQYSDRIVCVSKQTECDVIRHMSRFGDAPRTIVAKLGVRVASPNIDQLPSGAMPDQLYFVVLGTIEPRKNHQFLLAIWERLTQASDSPCLIVAGQRGWKNSAVFDALDNSPTNVFELNNLSDGAVSALMQSSCGLLFPSFCEGFGLPSAEAAALGVPVICNDLPVFHEILGEYPIYADVTDMYSWETKIRKLQNKCDMVNNRGKSGKPAVGLPTWDEHFNIVLRLT